MARKYGKKASEKIEQTMREWKRGELRTSAGKKVTSREQAVAIAISQARRAGYKVPPEPRGHAAKRDRAADLIASYGTWTSTYSNEDLDRTVGLANRLTAIDREEGRAAPPVGYSAKRYAQAKQVVRDTNRYGEKQQRLRAAGRTHARKKKAVGSTRHAMMGLDARVRTYLGKMPLGQEIDARGIARALGGGIDPLEADYALERAEKAGLAVTTDGRWFGPSRGAVAYASRKKYPYVAYWIRTRGGPRSSWDVVPVYVLGTTTRADEGIVGYDLRVRPLRLGKGPYTTVVSPDDVEDKP